jgi:hypothetical protein
MSRVRIGKQTLAQWLSDAILLIGIILDQLRKDWQGRPPDAQTNTAHWAQQPAATEREEIATKHGAKQSTTTHRATVTKGPAKPQQPHHKKKPPSPEDNLHHHKQGERLWQEEKRRVHQEFQATKCKIQKMHRVRAYQLWRATCHDLLQSPPAPPYYPCIKEYCDSKAVCLGGCSHGLKRVYKMQGNGHVDVKEELKKVR